MTTGDSSQVNAVTAIPSLARQRLADQIADVLREQMLTGALQPGQQIHERETSSALGVSRTPLREAILILETEGLIETSPARSPIVANPTLEELSELLEVLGALESLGGRLACANATPKQVKHIRKLYEIMVETNDDDDTVSFFRTDMEFHKTIMQASGNQALLTTHQHYNARLWRARYMSSRSRLGRIRTMEDHGEMVDGIESKDPDKTAAVMAHHLNCALINVTTIYQKKNTDQAKV